MFSILAVASSAWALKEPTPEELFKTNVECRGKTKSYILAIDYQKQNLKNLGVYASDETMCKQWNHRTFEIPFLLSQIKNPSNNSKNESSNPNFFFL